MGSSMPAAGNSRMDYSSMEKFRPPIPHEDFNGDVQSGFSYKFQTHLEVVDNKGMRGIGEVSKFDAACW